MVQANDLEKIHTTGFELEDVKIAFGRDIKTDVAGITIDAREGEIMNLPRYVANILEEQQYGKVQDTDMMVELKQALVKENVKDEFELATLDEHFYIKLKSYMKKLPKPDYDETESMLNSLLRKRHGKIVHLADSSKLTAELSNKMTVEEREFYNSLHETSAQFTAQILGEKA